LAAGEIAACAVEALLAQHPLPLAEEEAALYAVDGSVWARCDAETSPARGYYHHPSRHSHGQPIVAGWLYQWVAQVRLTADSWTAPLSVERVPPGANTNETAAAQVRRVVAGRPADGRLPLFAFDAGYDPVQLAQHLALATGGTRAALVVRLRSGRCFYADPPPYTGTGRPRRHGRKFACADPATWWAPDAERVADDPQYGRVRVRAWAGVHAKTQEHPTRGTRGPRPIERGTLLLLHVERLPRQTRVPQDVWLWWQGPPDTTPDLALVWRAYVHRFDLEVVRPQVTKPGVGAGLRRGHHVPDLHVAVGDHDAVDEQLHELPALLEGRPLQSYPEPRADRRRRAGDGGDLDRAVALRRQLPLAGAELLVTLAQVAVAPLEGGQIDGFGQVGVEEPLPLAGYAGAHVP
jgi:hypothetical protein